MLLIIFFYVVKLLYGEKMKRYLYYDFADEIKKSSITTKEEVKKGYIKRKTLINEKDYLKNKNGNYISYEILSDLNEQKLIKDLSKEIKKLIDSKYPHKNPFVLCFGIGNEFYSSDALGPKSIKKIIPTSHLKNKNGLCALIPGVMGSTGLESAKIAKGIINEYKIDLLIVVDSLITHDENRVFKIIQITDAGLSPGSGINNRRKALSQNYLNIPVIAIGVATALSSSAIEESLIKRIETNYKMRINRKILNRDIKYYTPKDSEEEIEFFSDVISSAINMCFDS